MKRTLFLSILIIFFTTSFMFIVGCNNQNSTKEQYQLQEQCGKRSDEYFKNENGNGIINDKEHSRKVSYKSHYNKKMNKCLILLDGKGVKKNNDKIYKMKTLLDVNESKKYRVILQFW